MHTLHAYIFKDDILDLSGVPHASHEGFAIVPMTDKFFALVGNPKTLAVAVLNKIKSYVEIQTDYFGGFGEQTAKLYIDGTEVYVSEPDTPINWALSKLGLVKAEGLDEFDTIKLGDYRSASDITDAWITANKANNPSNKSGLEIERRFLLKSLPAFINDRIFNGLRGKKITQFYVETATGEKLRLRKVFEADTKGGGAFRYYETKKTTIAYGTNQEDEREIAMEEFNAGLSNAKRKIDKTRYEYEDEESGLTWEIDDFGSLVIAEIEIPHIDHFVPIPDALDAVSIMEITGMDQFSNYKLSVPL